MMGFKARSYSQEAEWKFSIPPFVSNIECGEESKMCLFCAEGPGPRRLLNVAISRTREEEAQALCPFTLLAHRDGV